MVALTYGELMTQQEPLAGMIEAFIAERDAELVKPYRWKASLYKRPWLAAGYEEALRDMQTLLLRFVAPETENPGAKVVTYTVHPEVILEVLYSFADTARHNIQTGEDI